MVNEVGWLAVCLSARVTWTVIGEGCEYSRLSTKSRPCLDGACRDTARGSHSDGGGYWIDPVAWGGNSALAAFFIKSGGAIIDNMSVLFAVGVAYGMSKDKDGAAALAGFVGFLVLTTFFDERGLPPT